MRDLTEDQAQVIKQEMSKRLDDFLRSEVDKLIHITRAPKLGSGEIDTLFGVEALKERDRRLNAACDAAEGYLS